MADTNINSTGPAPNPLPGASVSLEIEQNVHFRQGFVQLCRYSWSRQVETFIDTTEDTISINMALTPRPSSTRISPLGQPGPERATEIGRLWVAMPGSLFRLIAPPGKLHSLRCHLELNRIEELLGHPLRRPTKDSPLEISGSNGEIEWLLSHMFQELRLPRLGQEIVIEAYANALCVELVRRIRDARPTRNRPVTGGLAPWRMKVVRDRCQQAGHAPTLPELAELCAMTVRHLSRAFKEETGETLGQFIQKTTIERACRLLFETDQTIARIANELGFSSTSSFSQAFKRMTGQLPSSTRKKQG